MRSNMWDVCCWWANGEHESATSYGGNVFFTGDTIYSYGTHYPMARLFELPGKRFALVNNDGYSMTTKKHRSLTLRALGTTPFVMVPQLFPDLRTHGHIDNLEWFRGRLLCAAGFCDHAHRYRESVKNVLEVSQRYAELFGLCATIALIYEYAMPLPKPEPLDRYNGRRRRSIRILGDEF